jgi:hypothetical protein
MPGMLKYSLLGAVVLLAACALADEVLDKFKQTYEFDKWPGKDGTLKQGLALKSLDLSPYEIASVRSRLETSGEMIFRYRVKGGTKHVFEVSLRVLDTVAEAQEHLLQYLSTCTVTIPNGSTLGLAVGDISFAAKDNNSFHTIAFVRNNVFIRITLMAKPAGEGEILPDISDIAKKIDAGIKNEAEVKTTAELNKPQVTEFSPASATVQPDKPVELTLDVKDPKGEKVELHIDEGGGMVYEESGKRYFKAEKPGTYTVTVCAVNEHFLVTKKSVTITVQK